MTIETHRYQYSRTFDVEFSQFPKSPTWKMSTNVHTAQLRIYFKDVLPQKCIRKRIFTKYPMPWFPSAKTQKYPNLFIKNVNILHLPIHKASFSKRIYWKRLRLKIKFRVHCSWAYTIRKQIFMGKRGKQRIFRRDKIHTRRKMYIIVLRL